MSLLYLLMGSAAGLSLTPKLGLGKQNSLPFLAGTFTSGIWVPVPEGSTDIS